MVVDLQQGDRVDSGESPAPATEPELPRTAALLAALAHDLRSPTHRVVGYASLIVERARADGTESRDAERVVDAGRIVQAMLDDLVDIARAELGALRPDAAQVDTVSLLRAATQDAAARISERGQSLAFEAAEAPCVYADQRLLANAFRRLLATASHIAPRGAKLRVSCAVDGDGVCISLVFPRLPTDATGDIDLPGTAWKFALRLAETAAHASGGILERSLVDGVKQVALRLPQGPHR